MTVESLKSVSTFSFAFFATKLVSTHNLTPWFSQKLAEHRMQREQQEREIRALREAKFRQFEEWQRQQEQLLQDNKKDEPPRRLV